MNKPIKPKPEHYNAVITGTGSCVPEKILTNEDFTKIVETFDEWITTRTGIKQRHIAGDNDTTGSLSAEAAKRALKAADATPDEIELILVGTITPEMVFPSTACFIQDIIGAKNAWAFDLSAACSGFVYAVSIAHQFILSGRHKKILVIGAETLSKITDYDDRKSCILFGDGAGAVVIEAMKDGPLGVMYSTSSSDGSGWTSLNCKAYGSRFPVSRPLEDEKMIYMNINGREVYQLAVRRIVELVEDCLQACNLTKDDIKLYIPHQMNARIIESVAKRLGLKDESVFINIDRFGNTSAASIPIALDECVRSGKITPGDIVLFAAFGGGLTWGANVVQF